MASIVYASVPVTIYEHGKEIAAGEMVVNAGHIFVCRVAGTTKTPREAPGPQQVSRVGIVDGTATFDHVCAYIPTPGR